MTKSRKWAAWLAAGALAANLLVPLGAGAAQLREPEPREPYSGDPDQPNPGGPAQFRQTVFLEIGTVLVFGQSIRIRLRIDLLEALGRATS